MAVRYLCTLASFTAAADTWVKPSSVTLQGTVNGTDWTTIPADQYLIGYLSGQLVQRSVDDSNNIVSWTTYRDYQDLGNTAFRATYTVVDGYVETTTTNQAQTFADEDTNLITIGPDGQVLGEYIRRLVADFILAAAGKVVIDTNGITGLSQTPGTSPFVRWLTSAGVKTGDIQSRTDAPDLQGDIVVKGYGPDGTNHYGVAALAAQDNDGTVSALWLTSDGQLQHKILNDTNMGLIPALYARDYGGTTVANTTVETTIFTKTIKAKSLGANGLMQLTIGGEFKNNVTNTITFKVKFGGTTMNTLTMDVSAFGTGSGGYVIRELFIMPNSASSEQSVADAVINVGANARSASDYGTAAKDTTSDQDLVVTAKWTTADTSSGIYTKCGVLMLSNAR